jgi:hypothetical protein
VLSGGSRRYTQLPSDDRSNRACLDKSAFPVWRPSCLPEGRKRMPQATLRINVDGREETISEYICDWPDCPASVSAAPAPAILNVTMRATSITVTTTAAL